MTSKTRRLSAAIVAGIHLFGILLTWLYVSNSSEGQASLLWVYWAFIDFPFSLLYSLLDNNFLVVHGAIGTVWWYFLTALLINLISIVSGVFRRRSPI